MKIVMQLCVLMFCILAFWGSTDVIKSVLDGWRINKMASVFVSVCLSVAVVLALMFGMLQGAISA